MCEDNQTQVTQFHLLGFQGLHKFKPLFFTGCLLCYIVILGGNFLTVILVTIDDHLKIPMFFFLKHLAIADVLVTTSLVPMLLQIILEEEETLSLVTCFVQMFFSQVFGPVAAYLLVAMSYDRFLAICKPLRYGFMMSPRVCQQLVIGSWFISTLLVSCEMIFVCQFSYCGLNYIDNFYCEIGAIVKLSTSEKSIFMVFDLIVLIFVMPFPFALIILTYSFIFFTILKIPSAIGRKKAFSTCSSHLATVCTCYGTLIMVFMVPADDSMANINKYIFLLCVVVTPMMNPIIYSLSNKEIRKAFQKLLSGNGIRV